MTHPLYSKPPDPTPEESSRRSAVTQRAIEVFGNDFDAACWLGERPQSPQGISQHTHRERATGSQEGLQEVLGLLEELSKTTNPKPLPKVIAAARSGRRVRRRKGPQCLD